MCSPPGASTEPPTFDPRAYFPQFYENDSITGHLADTSRWTISGRLSDDSTKRKAPVDLRALLDDGKIRGAWALDDRCLLTLDEMTRDMPAAANCAFYLRAQSDGLMVVDIEADCPSDIAAQLLALPEALYTELSMSGHGYHVLVPLPDNFWDFENATSKVVLREEHGWYEILLEHWITFTRNPVPADSPLLTSPPAGSIDPKLSSVSSLYASLAAVARPPTASASALDVELEKPDIPNAGSLIDLMTRGWKDSGPGRFDGDLSRWEFSVISRLYSRLLPYLLNYTSQNGHRYTESDQAWLLYRAAQQVLPHRSKHDETRNSRPFLLERAAALIAERTAQRP